MQNGSIKYKIFQDSQNGLIKNKRFQDSKRKHYKTVKVAKGSNC